jgi:hypothetical protein
MASTVNYPSDQVASKEAVLAWLHENAPDAEVVSFDDKQFDELERSMPPNERFMSCAKQSPRAGRVALTHKSECEPGTDTVLAYWFGTRRKD